MWNDEDRLAIARLPRGSVKFEGVEEEQGSSSDEDFLRRRTWLQYEPFDEEDFKTELEGDLITSPSITI